MEPTDVHTRGPAKATEPERTTDQLVAAPNRISGGLALAFPALIPAGIAAAWLAGIRGGAVLTVTLVLTAMFAPATIWTARMIANVRWARITADGERFELRYLERSGRRADVVSFAWSAFRGARSHRRGPSDREVAVRALSGGRGPRPTGSTILRVRLDDRLVDVPVNPFRADAEVIAARLKRVSKLGIQSLKPDPAEVSAQSARFRQPVDLPSTWWPWATRHVRLTEHGLEYGRFDSRRSIIPWERIVCAHVLDEKVQLELSDGDALDVRARGGGSRADLAERLAPRVSVEETGRDGKPVRRERAILPG